MRVPLGRRVASFPFVVLLLCALVPACSLLQGQPPAPLHTYTLDGDAPVVNAPQTPGGRVLLVEAPHAAAGYDSTRMLYVLHAQAQDAFANSAWADTPARMLAPMLVASLRQSGQFRAVLQAPTLAKASLRLETTVLRLQHEFLQLPSSVRFTLQVTLLDSATRDVVAWRTFDVVQSAPSEDAEGGAIAAHAAVQEGLKQLAQFLQTELARLPATPAPATAIP